jgi:tetratricopeptide (TPR) repeat protein
VLAQVDETAAKLPSDHRLVAEIGLLRAKVCQARGLVDEARTWFEASESNEALDSSQRAAATLGAARALQLQGHSDEANGRLRELVEQEAPPLVHAGAWNDLADVALEEGRQRRDADRITDALYGYLRGVVLYLPQPGESTVEHRRALAGAAQCFEYLSQLAEDLDEKSLNRRRAADLRDRLEHK